MALSDAERAKQYRERKRDGSVTESVTGVTEPGETVTTRVTVKRADLSVPQLVALARAGQIELTSHEEDQIRFEFGYAPSENRTLATRDAVAARLKAQQRIDGETVSRYALDGTPVEEPVGPYGLSLVAFPNQR